MKNSLLILVFISVIASACRRTDTPALSSEGKTVENTVTGLVVADTIIYDVRIQAGNPDDEWAIECLRGLNHSQLIGHIFDMVYHGKATAYNHETGEKLTTDQLQKLENGEGFSRDNISMIQFTEIWFVDPETARMTKKVIRMVLGMDRYNASGEFLGHAAVFRVEMGS